LEIAIQCLEGGSSAMPRRAPRKVVG